MPPVSGAATKDHDEKPYRLYMLSFPNGKRYIGITGKDVERRWCRHRSDARLRSPRCRVHQAIAKYGDANVGVHELLVGPKQFILEMECRLIAAYDATNPRNGYNLSLGGEVSPMLSPRVSEKFRGRKRSDETREKMRHPHVMSEKGRAALALSRRGKKLSPETIEKIRAARAKQVFSEEANLKRAAASAGRRHSEETRRKMSAAMLGKPTGRKTRGMTGLKHSEATKTKMRLAHAARRAQKREIHASGI